MSLLASKKAKSQCPAACVAIKWLIALLLFLCSIAAAVGIYQTHVIPDGVQFGSTGGSLSILAFTVSLVAWFKQIVFCMSPCEVCMANK